MRSYVACCLKLLSFAAVLVATAASAAEPDGVVVGWDPHDGRLLLGELNCTACHQNAGDGAYLLSKQPPVLTKVGGRVTPQYLAHFLSAPQQAKPGTAMPDMLHALKPADRQQAVDELVHFLASLGGPIDQRSSGSSQYQIKQGKALYHQVGCVACHKPYQPPPEHKPDPNQQVDPEAALTADGHASPTIPHPDLAMKTTVQALANFLRDPLHVRPSARMPSLNLQPGEANLIAAYLLREQFSEEKGGFGVGLDFAFYKGRWNKIPDFDKLKPQEEGTAKGFDLKEIKLNQGKLKSDFGIRYRGVIEVPETGKYIFGTRSDDGTILKINGKIVVNNDGMHGAQDKRGEVDLTEGRHAIELGFIQGGGPFEMKVSWQPPGKKKLQPIPPGILLHGAHAMIPKGIVDFQVDPAKAAAGKKRFVELGCATCHETGDKQLAAESLAKWKGPALADLKPQQRGGCTSAKPASQRPHFALSEKQRTAIASALGKLKQQPQLSPAEQVVHSMKSFNCFACHSRNDLGGPDRERQAYFTTLVTVDLGDEGRLPPHLNVVGRKLTPEGFQAILFEGAKVRPHMATRMPAFGKPNVGSLPDLLAKADAAKVQPHEPSFSSRMVDDGRKLVGKGALGCINCHAWGGHRLSGADGLDLLDMPARLTPGYFQKLLKNPQALRPGTRMPTAWPGGKTFFPKMQGGDVEKQIDAIWAYLSVGAKGGMPQGLSPDDDTKLIPREEPIVFRTFLKDVGAHAIAVGYRHGTHVAFDALRVRMALGWTGEFLSAKAAWDGRAGQYAQVPSHDVVAFPPGNAFAVLASHADPWPAIDRKVKAHPPGWKFRGYRFREDRTPTFLYRFEEIDIAETATTDYRQDGAYLLRTFQVTAPKEVQDFWFRAAVGKQIAEQADGSFLVDGKLTLRIKTAPKSQPSVRKVEGGQELLVPVSWAAGGNGGEREAKLEVELTW